MKSSTMIGGASDENKRHASDFYETPAECTVALMDFLQLQQEHPFPTVEDPACGNGAIIEVLRKYLPGDQIFGRDIRITSHSLFEDCFLTSERYTKGYVDWIITNPPFNLSEQFIRKALSYTPNVAMLLKATYWHPRKRKKLFDEKPPAFILPLTWRPAMAPERGTAPTMDFMWTVWSDEVYLEKSIYKPLSRPTKQRMKELGL